jgi:hypothetical protein
MRPPRWEKHVTKEWLRPAVTQASAVPLARQAQPMFGIIVFAYTTAKRLRKAQACLSSGGTGSRIRTRNQNRSRPQVSAAVGGCSESHSREAESRPPTPPPSFARLREVVRDQHSRMIGFVRGSPSKVIIHWRRLIHHLVYWLGHTVHSSGRRSAAAGHDRSSH